jgi:periplasmic divalent cation tolerance protein
MTDKSQCLVLCTCPDQTTARKLADKLVEKQLAACVNIISGLESIYRWQGNIEHDQELLLLIKTRQQAVEQVSREIQTLHPYELPEIIAVPIVAGLNSYLQWIENNVVTQ